MTDLAAQFKARLDALAPAGPLGLAVSGGGDSIALLHLALSAGLQVQAATVDHGLRPEAAAEARQVGELCATLGVPHQVLRWHWDGKGNLQDAARRGRRAVLASWAKSSGLTAVALGHTRDDVAETFLMRLARGAGVDGLSAMAARFNDAGMMWLRPLLPFARAELRQYLTSLDAEWVEDPSNDNTRFDRVRVRKAMTGLRSLGLTPERLAEVAAHMAEARRGLEQATDAAAVRTLSVNANAVCIHMPDLADEAPEIQRRLIQRVILHVSPSDYGPRGVALQALLARLTEGKPAMLAGCRFLPDRKRHCIWAFREARAVAGVETPPDQWWDGQWQITGPVPPGACLRALGPALAQCPEWRAMHAPRAALMVSPALWLDGRLIAAPHAGLGKDYSANSLFGADALYHSVLSH